MQTIRWGIIGCGDVTEVKSGPAFQKIDGSQLVAVMRRDGDRARDYARRHDVPRAYDDAQQLIDDPEVDAVYIATPPNVHEELTLQVARAGKPVYVEKPMARSFPECERMIEACAKANVPLFVAYYRRTLPRFVRVKTLLDEGEIGRVTDVNVTLHQTARSYEGALPWRVVPEISGGGLFVDLASHTLDLFDYLLGPIHILLGEARNAAGLHDAEDAVRALWRHPHDVRSEGDWNFAAKSRRDEIEIIGDAGKILCSTFGNEPIRLIRGDQVEEFDRPNPPHVQQPLIQTVVDQLLGRGVCPSMGESAARTNRVMDEMLRSYREASGIAFP